MQRQALLIALAVLPALATLTIVDARPAMAQGSTTPGEAFLGVRVVDGRHDRDTISVSADIPVGAIQLRVDGSDLVMHDVKIVFQSGETFEPKTRLVFKEGSTSRWIDLPGGGRRIRRIEFSYGNLAKGGKARVEVRGTVAQQR